MENTNISSLMETTMTKIRDMVDVNTVVGAPITTPDGITVIPVSRISYAFATGGSDFRVKEKPAFGGGNGAGVKIEPIGFLVVKDGNIRMVSVTLPANNTIDRVIEKAPELMDTVESFIKKRSGGEGE
jgi:sporulation protein YtfJ